LPQGDLMPAGDSYTSRLRWVMIALVFLATVINYLDRQTLSVLAPVLQDQFQMSATAYGRIVFLFMLAYTIVNGLSGPIIDRLGTKAGYALMIAWWSAAEVLHAFSRGVVSLGVFRFLLGMGEAGNWPAGVRVVAEWFPPKERALASGIFNSGSSIGALMAPPLVAWIVLHFGWPRAFLVVGLSGFGWIAAWWIIYRTPVNREPGEQIRAVPIKQLLRGRFLWQFTASKALSDPVWYFYIFWFPQYLKTARGFTLLQIGRTAWVPFLAADAGNLLGGGFSLFLIRRGHSVHSAHRLAIVLCSLLMTAAIPAVLVPSAAQAIGLVSIAAFGYTGAMANMLAIPADAFPKNAVASVWGVASMGSGFGGMLFSLITGHIVDHYSFTAAFVLFGILPLFAATLVWFLPPDHVANATPQVVRSADD
jgi:MFS transporter, ACS family, hexuronate transporter